MLIIATLLLLTLLLGLVRVWLGPSRTDRLLAVQLLGSGGAALLLLLAVELSAPGLRHAALTLALLAAVTSAALAHYLRVRR